MVSSHRKTDLSEFAVQDRTLLRGERELASFPTPICQLARLDDRLFVVLHSYPGKDHPEYAGSNLWALDLDGNLLWKARQLNAGWAESQLRPRPFRSLLNAYGSLKLFDADHPKLWVMTMDDRNNPIIDAATGEGLGDLGGKWKFEEVERTILAKSRMYLNALPTTPPEQSKLSEWQL